MYVAPTAGVDLMAPMPEPNAPTTSGAMYVGPNPSGAGLSPEQQAALQSRLAAATAGPARSIAPPPGMGGGGVPVPDLGPIYQSAFQSFPVDQAGKAIEAAVRYQGQRGYQLDIQGGMPADRAMAKWGPLLFHSAPGAMSTAMRGLTASPQQTGPIQAQPILDQTGKPIPGRYGFRSGNAVHMISPPAGTEMTAWQKADMALRRELSETAQKDKQMESLRKEIEAMQKPGEPAMQQITPKTDEKTAQDILNAKRRLHNFQNQYDDLIFGQSKTAPAATAPSTKKKFKDAQGKTWVYTGNASNPLSDTTQENWKEE
jgi:hypothetical protein